MSAPSRAQQDLHARQPAGGCAPPVSPSVVRGDDHNQPIRMQPCFRTVAKLMRADATFG